MKLILVGTQKDYDDFISRHAKGSSCDLCESMKSTCGPDCEKQLREIVEHQIPPRWRASHGGSYYCLNSRFKPERSPEAGDSSDRERWESGNYFETEETAKAAAAKIIDMLTN